MNCNETQRILEADVDGELDLVRHLELQEHLGTCPSCAASRETLVARRAALRESLPRFAAPPELAEKVRAALRAKGMPVTMPTRPVRLAAISWPGWGVAGIAASIAFALVAGYSWGNARARGNLLVEEAVSDHVRSLQFNHLSDVASTDRHTVKPWFAGKLDFSPPVVDLASAGYPLTGGRLERLDGRPAAALVFHRRAHAINLFIWSAARDAVPARHTELNGYHLESWSQAGFNFLAVSDIPTAELSEFSAAFRSANSN
ncbi:MAG: anti-sigma factor [Verrucomicrobia bacterium]|nr:anti-sigma factor [Verrucomicrobiota bacterium]